MNFSKTIKDAFSPLFAGNSGVLKILWLPAFALIAGNFWESPSTYSFYSERVELGFWFDLDAMTTPSLAYFCILVLLFSVASINWHRTKMLGGKQTPYFWIMALNAGGKLRHLAFQAHLTFVFRLLQLYGILLLSSVIIFLLFALTVIGPEMMRAYGAWIGIPVQLVTWILVPVAALSLAAVSVGAKKNRIRDFFRPYFDAAPSFWLAHMFVLAFCILAVTLACLIVFFMVFGFIQLFAVPVPEFDPSMIGQSSVWNRYYIKVPMLSTTIGIHEQVAAKYNLNVAAIAQAADYSDRIGGLILPLLLLLAHSGANASIYQQLKGKVKDKLVTQEHASDSDRALPSQASAEWQLPKSLGAKTVE